MGESNGNRQTGQNQSLQKTSNERNGKKQPKEVEDILSIYNFMVAEKLQEITFEQDNSRFYIKRKSTSTEQPVLRSPIKTKKEPTEEPATDLISITSPLSGTFYAAPKPNMPPYVSAGSTVNPGDTLCIVEAMKVMNEIKADSKYKIIKILATNAKPVSANETLFLVKPL